MPLNVKHAIEKTTRKAQLLLAVVNVKGGRPTSRRQAEWFLGVLVMSSLSILLINICIISLQIKLFLLTIVILEVAVFFAPGIAASLERKALEESELPFVASMLASTMLRPIQALQKIGRSQVFYFSNEVQLISKIKKLTGVDNYTAIKFVVENHPSKKVATFLEDLIILELYGNPIRGLREKMREAVRELESVLTNLEISIPGFTDIVFGMLVTVPALATPLLLMTNPSEGLVTFSCIIIPVISSLIIYSLCEMIYIPIYNPEISILETLKITISLIATPLAMSVLRQASQLNNYVLGASIVLASLPSAILAMILSKRTTQLIEDAARLTRDLADMFRDGISLDISLSKVRKMGSYRSAMVRILEKLDDLSSKLGMEQALKIIVKERLPRSVKYIFESLRFCALYGTSPEAFTSLVSIAVTVAVVKRRILQKTIIYLLYFIMGLIVLAASLTITIRYVIVPIYSISKNTQIQVLMALPPEVINRISNLINIGLIASSLTLSITLGKIRDGSAVLGIKYLPLLYTPALLTVYVIAELGVLDSLLGWRLWIPETS